MASVLIDTDTYKITLRIIEDFINSDFENFLKNGYDSKSKKIITWEMLIYCKMLDNKNIGYTNYYLLQLKKLIKERLNENLYLHIYKEQKEDFYINTYSDNKKHGHFFITPKVLICENPALIQVYFYCDETKTISIPGMFFKSAYLKYFEDLRKITYVSQLQNLISLVFSTIEKSEYFIKIAKCKYPVLNEIIKSSVFNKIGNRKLSVFGIIHLILANHYMKILDNLNNIAIKEISDEVIKQVLNCQIDIKKLTQKYNTVKDFREIHINKFYKVNVIKQINKYLEN